MRPVALALASALLAAGVAAATLGDALAGKDEPKPSVRYARTWDLAVAEAKLLNLPIVVHNHGLD